MCRVKRKHFTQLFVKNKLRFILLIFNFAGDSREEIMPQISVIVPVYNVESFLRKCLDSIMQQSFQDFEVIIVDDGSTDSSGSIAQEYVKEYANVQMITQENGGLGAARNTGISAAKGEFLLFVDSDDTIDKNTLQVLMDTVNSTNADLVIFDFLSEDLHGNVTQISEECVQKNSDATLSQCPQLLLDWPASWNKFYHRKLFIDTEIRFPKKVWYEDFRTTPKILTLASHIEYVNKPFYHYLQRPGSIMRSANVDRNKEIIDAFDDLVNYFKEHKLFDAYYQELEYLAVLHIFILASVRVLKANRKHPLLKIFRSYVKENFPNYKQNPYLNRLTKKERIILKFLDSGNFMALDALLKIRNII